MLFFCHLPSLPLRESVNHLCEARGFTREPGQTQWAPLENFPAWQDSLLTGREKRDWICPDVRSLRTMARYNSTFTTKTTQQRGQVDMTRRSTALLAASSKSSSFLFSFHWAHQQDTQEGEKWVVSGPPLSSESPELHPTASHHQHEHWTLCTSSVSLPLCERSEHASKGPH